MIQDHRNESFQLTSSIQQLENVLQQLRAQKERLDKTVADMDVKRATLEEELWPDDLTEPGTPTNKSGTRPLTEKERRAGKERHEV